MFYGWIPTNKGQIEYEFISISSFENKSILSFDSSGLSKSLNIKLNFMDDAYIFRNISLKNNTNLDTFAYITINNRLDGNIRIVWEDTKFSSDFRIYKNGIIKFVDFNYYTKTDNVDIESIKQVMYVLVKSWVHGDAHHHQKIDIALKINNNNFNTGKISKSLLNYIKRIERNVKLNSECDSNLKNENILEEAKGYLSYLETFVLLFPSKTTKLDLALSKNIISSLESILNKRGNKVSYTNSFYTAIFTFLGLFISINILLNGFWFSKSNDITIAMHSYSRFDVLIVTFFLILICFFSFIKCRVKAYIFYEHYEIFEILKYIKYSKKSELNKLGNLIKAMPLIFFIIAMYSLQYYLIG